MNHKTRRIASVDTKTFPLHERVELRDSAIPLPESRPVEIRLALLDLLLLMMASILVIGTAQQLDRFGGRHDALILALNMALASGFCFCFRYFDLSEGRHSLGKALLMGLSLWMLNAVMIGFLSSHTPLASWGASFAIFSVFALISGILHYELSRPFMVQKLESPCYLLELGIKRAFDFTLSALGLIAVSPLLLVVAVALSLESSGSPIFSQIRIGKGENRFRMYKFRSMIKNAESLSVESKTVLFKRENDPRITRIGSILRKLSIDELPQLFNVLKGEMSLVGPRPPLENEFELMNRYHKRKFEATPGLTGHWQIVGRVKKQREFDSVAAYDVYYIENWCLLEDFRILLKTIPVVLLQKGAC